MNISRQKLIEELDNLSLSVEVWTSMKSSEIVKITIEAYRNFVMETINSQPPADQWIPCSERLPDENGKYDVTVWDEVIGLYTTEWHFYNGKFTPFMNYRERNIKAWKERPEPYKGVE